MNGARIKHIFYVATDGNDRCSGLSPTRNGKGTNGPWATLEGARDKLRCLRRQGAITGWTPGTINGIACWQVTLPEVSAGRWHSRSLAKQKLPPGTEAFVLDLVVSAHVPGEPGRKCCHFACAIHPYLNSECYARVTIQGGVR